MGGYEGFQAAAGSSSLRRSSCLWGANGARMSCQMQWGGSLCIRPGIHYGPVQRGKK